jgi:hypothetical protein
VKNANVNGAYFCKAPIFLRHRVTQDYAMTGSRKEFRIVDGEHLKMRLEYAKTWMCTNFGNFRCLIMTMFFIFVSNCSQKQATLSKTKDFDTECEGNNHDSTELI